MAATRHQLIPLDVQRPIWDRFFSVAPLVIVGTREPDGKYDLAPKHRPCPWATITILGLSARRVTAPIKTLCENVPLL
ncbi:MAG: hypothetical protein AAFV72_06845 [Cyanobacteria bacterium J06635_1]